MNLMVEIFLNKHKELWLRKELKEKTSDSKKEKLIAKANEMFSKTTLSLTIKSLVDNKNIDRLNFTSHIAKFSNPSVKLNGFIAKPNGSNDGLLRTGNVNQMGLDIYSNSGAIDHTKELIYVYEFLTTYMSDGEMIIEHLQKNDKTKVKELFSTLDIKEDEFSEICNQLLLMVNKNQPTKTSEAIKQVYFPVEDDYHLLSVLYPSPVMSELRLRIQEMKFNENIKQAKEDKKNNKYNNQEISDIYNLTKIGFGGANKQNVSVLNNKNGGDFYLLPSVPPSLKKRNIQPPKTNFFTNCLYAKNFDKDFKKLHKLFSDADTMHIKNQRRYWVKHIIYQVVEKVWQVRYIDAGWSNSDTYNSLKPYQSLWLDTAQKQRRNEVDFDLIKKDLSNWIVKTYNKNIDKNTTKLGDDHKPYIKTIIDEMQEALL